MNRAIRRWCTSAVLLLLIAAGAASAQVRLDLRDTNIRDFLAIVAESTGQNFIIDPRVQGTITVLAPTPVSPDTLEEIFFNVLELNRLTLVEGGEVDRIVPLDIAREIAPGQATARGEGYETRVIELQSARARDVEEIVRPLLAPEAVLSVVPDRNLLILSDRLESFQRLQRLVTELDRPVASSDETIRLQNGNAGDILDVIQGLDITPEGASVNADNRSNVLVVSGDTAFRQRIRRLVMELDTPQREITTEIVQLNYADAAQLEAVAQASFAAARPSDTGAGGGEITIVAETQGNALIVTGPSDRVHAIARSIRELDVRPQQVLIEAVIFELSVDNFSDLSVQFGALLNDALVGGVEFALQGRPTLTGLVGSVLSNQVPSPGSGVTLGGTTQSGDQRSGIVGFLSALTSQSSARLLSTPSILTLNNEEARIVVAQNVPFVTGSFTSTGDSSNPQNPFQTIERQDVGLTLEVTPQITADNTVRLRIEQEVSNLTNTASAAGGEITSRRTLSTNALVRDNHVIMLGGLVEDGSGAVTQGVPGLSRAPIIGALFRGRNVSSSQRVLLIMLRPRILGSDHEVTRETRRVAQQARRVSDFISPLDDGIYPQLPDQRLPFDGVNLDRLFEPGPVDIVARDRLFPTLPRRLEFEE